jgi:hypothetical protein
MHRRQDIDRILRDWEFDPSEISVRLIEAGDGRELLQMRVELGLLQLEAKGRPDGRRPGGAATYYDYLLGLAIHEGDGLELDDEQCVDADRELVQYYHRRICWLVLREYRRAVSDADHSLGFMDFLKGISPSEEWTQSHEQYRPFILFHRTQAAALAELESSTPEAAVEEVNRGLDRLRDFFETHEVEEQFEEDDIVQRLVELRESLREQYQVGQTLAEQLAEAVAKEQYELAADLRDQIAKRQPKARMKRARRG